MSAFVCYCNCPDSDSARRIAGTLVEERLAACVNILPGVVSVYRWEGVVQRADEVLLMIKTSGARLPALIIRVGELHPYELPEVIAIELAAGLPAYLAWIASETDGQP